MREPNEYALYHGDTFIMIGTVKELAQRLRTSEATIRFYSTPSYKKRQKNGYVVVRV